MSKSKSDWLLFNPITTHRNARWFAVTAFLAGHAALLAGKYLTHTFWSGYLCLVLGLLLWTIPVMWCAKMFATGGKNNVK